MLKKKRNLWERRIDQQDFLTVRVGLGKAPLKLKVNFNKEDFSIEEDELKKSASKSVSKANKSTKKVEK